MSEKEVKNITSEIFGSKAKVLVPIIGGMMNYSYIVENENKERFVLYIPSESGKDMVVRSLEKENIDIIAPLKISSENVYFNIHTGIKANRYIAGHSLDQEALKEEDYPHLATLFKKLHASKKLSRSDYPLFISLAAYENELFSSTNEVDAHYFELKDFLYSYKSYLLDFKKALCHNDAQRSNIIKGIDGKFYFIDFEFMMNNDPIYDVAAFGNNDVKEGVKLLEHVYRPTRERHYKRYYLWRIYISLQWYLVALIKNKKDGLTLGIDFTKVATHFLNNALEAYQSLLQFVKK